MKVFLILFMMINLSMFAHADITTFQCDPSYSEESLGNGEAPTTKKTLAFTDSSGYYALYLEGFEGSRVDPKLFSVKFKSSKQEYILSFKQNYLNQIFSFNTDNQYVLSSMGKEDYLGTFTEYKKTLDGKRGQKVKQINCLVQQD